MLGGTYLHIGDDTGVWNPDGDSSLCFPELIAQYIKNNYGPISFINKAQRGANSSDLVNDVWYNSRFSPDIVTICSNENDIFITNTGIANYKNNIKLLIQRFQSKNPNVIIILCAPTQMTNSSDTPYMASYLSVLQSLANNINVFCCDLSQAWISTRNSTYLDATGTIPNTWGHYMIATYLWNFLTSNSIIDKYLNSILVSPSSYDFLSQKDPRVVIMFDDGYKTVVSQALPIFQSVNIVANTAVISNTVLSSDSNYMRISDLSTLKSAGWNICNHTTNHLNLSTQPDNGLYEISNCETFLSQNGFTTGFLMYPNGYYSSSVINVAISLGIKLARISSSPMGYDISLPIPSPNTNWYTLPTQPIGTTISTSTPTLNSNLAILNTIKKTGESAIFMGHNITATPQFDYDVTPSNLNIFADALRASGISCMTISDWYNYASSRR